MNRVANQILVHSMDFGLDLACYLAGGVSMKNIIITGACSGIGLATARLFGKKGWHVILVDLDEKKMTPILKEFQDNYSFSFYPVNVADHQGVQEAFKKMETECGQIHGLVNNAGIVRDNLLLKMTESEFDSVIAVNLKGVFNWGKVVAENMKTHQSGAIVNISSVCGLFGNVGQTNYVASKWGVIGMTKTWAKELGRYGIRCNAIAPGFIETEMIQSIPEPIQKAMHQKIALNRGGKPEEVAESIDFLISDQASFVTGSVLEVTGGMTL